MSTETTHAALGSFRQERIATSVRPLTFGSGCRLLFALAWAWLCCPHVGWTQETTGSKPPAAATTPPSAPLQVAPTIGPAVAPGTKPSEGLGLLETKVRYLFNSQGDLVPVPLDARLEDFLKSLEQDRDATVRVNPVVSVTSLELTGTADDQLATLDAIVRVQVTGSNQPLLFPLGFNEGVLLQEAKITGPGRVVFGDKDPQQGYRWWFDGNGSYEMQLRLAVQVRRVSPWRRLQLALPNSPVTTLQVTLPEAKPVIKLPEEIVWETKSPTESTTSVRALGIGNRLDLQWQPTIPVDNQRTSFDVNTTLLVRPDSRGFLLEATQYVRALQGTFSEYTVHLPEHAELLQAEGTEVKRTRMVPESQNQIVVELNSPTRGPVIVKWKLHLTHKTSKRSILKGFQVDQAQTESGEIGLLSPDTARWSNVETASRNLERMNAGELRSTLGGAQIVRAYRFYDQPFELPLELQAADPYLDVRPTLVLYASRDELRLDGRFEIRSFRGQLNELSLDWSGWKNDGWKLEPAPSNETFYSSFPVEDPQDADRLLIPIENPPNTSFVVRFTAVKQAINKQTALNLPRLLNAALSRTRLVFLHAENVDAELMPRGESVLRLASRDDSVTSEAVGYDAGLETKLYWLESDERQFAITVTPQPIHVTVQNQSQVAISDWHLQITQALQHHVQYERLSTVTIAVPTEIAQAVQFRLGDEELRPQWLVPEDPKVRWAQLTLPRPTLGLFELQASWEQPLPVDLRSEKDAALVIPFLKSLSGNITSQSLEFLRPAWYEISSVDAQWQLVHSTRESNRWTDTTGSDSFTGLIIPTTGNDGAEFVTQRAWISVINDRTGLQQYRVQMRLSGSAPGLNVQLPAASLVTQFYRDGELIPESQIIESPTGSRRFTLSWSTNATEPADRWLTIEYTLKQPPITGLSALVRTEGPTFPQVRWASRVLWQIQVPNDQHAFRLPDNAVPLYEWRRAGVVWQRESAITTDQLQAWLGGPLPFSSERLVSSGHEYTFSQFGPIENLRLRTLSSAMLLVCGAGSTLLLGFLVIKVPAMRSLLAVLLMLSAGMAAALCFQPELELLLQPMVIGGLLAGLLGLQEYLSTRHQRGTILTLSGSPSELRIDPRDGSATHSLLVRSHDSATVFRTASSEDGSQGRIPVESHAG
ncbi:hypothetical protein GC163_04720 [bacterium]|nr:hypothetical protein [bacterium]